MRILLVDDDHADVAVIRQTLTRELGNELFLETAHSLAEARRCLQTNESFDVVLLDVKLPDGNGSDLIGEIRDRNLSTAIVVTTGIGDEELAISLLKAGANDFIHKSPGFEHRLPGILQATVARNLESRQLRSGRLRVLYCEHNEADIDQTRRHLKEHAQFIELSVCRSAQEALDSFEKDSDYELPDVVLTDYRMPGKSGLDLLRALREDLKLDIPVIIISGQGDENIAIQAIRLGAADYIVKHPAYLYSLHLALENAYYYALLRREMSERKLSEARLEQAVRAANIGFFDWDIASDDVYYSPEWKKQLGHESDDPLHGFEAWETRLHPDDREEAKETVEAYLANPQGQFQSEFRLRHKDGSWRSILAQGKLLELPDSGKKRLLGTHTDITDYRKLEAQYWQSQRMESIGRLAGGVAHDFNNLVSIINGYASFALSEVPEGGRAWQDLQEVIKAGDSAAALTRQLLAFSRKQVLKPVTVDVNQAISDLYKMLSRFLGEDIEVIFRLDAEKSFIMIDPGQFEQILINLSVNARDAMPKGGELIFETKNVILDDHHAVTLKQLDCGHYVMVAISDTGTGIKEEDFNKIFEPFFTTKEGGRGTGLGLSTVHGIVEQSNGAIFVYSEPGQGTTMKIYFPVVQSTLDNLEFERVDADASGDETVLVVEDSNELRSLTERMLKKAGYRVESAASGMDALEKLNDPSFHVDVLLTDVVMPKISGPDVVREAKKIRPDLKTAYMSGYTDESIKRHGNFSNLHLLTKPFTSAELTKHIRDALS